MDLTEREKRLIARETHFSGVYQMMCMQNPIEELKSGNGFRIKSTDVNYDDTVILYSEIKKK